MEEKNRTYAEYYLGTVVEVLDKALYQIKVDIPGVFDGVKAFPVRGEIDEPKEGDFVLLRSFDPVYHSYFLYQKLKENDFIGFRSLGKMIEVDPSGDFIQICTFDIDTEYTDGKQGSEYKPEPQDWIKLDKEGNMDIYLRNKGRATIDGDGEVIVEGNVTIKIGGNSKINIEGESEITVMGDLKVNSSSNIEIKACAETTIQAPSINIKGPGLLTCKGQTIPNAAGGPFIAVPVAPAPGTPMIAGNQILLQ